MKKLIKFIKSKTASDSGTIFLIGISLILAVVSMISSVSLVFSAQSDFTHVLYSQDAFQEDLLARSENMRTNIRASYDKFSPMPSNSISIESSETKTTYYIKNKNRILPQEEFMGFPLQEVMTIRSLITAKRSPSHFNTGYISPIKRYCERLLSDESLARYQYFTNTEASENADGGQDAGDVHFWGPDEFFGKVFSNDDIWISDVGGWPTFHDFVGTAGIFRYSPGGEHLISHGVDYDVLFPAGWAEHAAPIVYNPTADLVRQHGLRLFDGFQDYDIARVHLNGASFNSMVGKITLDEIKPFPVYSWYPKDSAEANAAVTAGYNWFEEEDSLYTNHIPIYDTLWTTGPSATVAGHSVFVDGLQLWIDGEVSGNQTWACSDTIYIVDNITYSGTPAGQAPDSTNINHNDYFGLISEQRIYIKYKFKDPLNLGQLNDHNCYGIYLYGAYAALGQADPAIYGEHACHHDGVFTYEYQHPHGSTPNFVAPSPYTGEDTLYTYIDLHKFIFPKNYFVPPNLLPYNIHGNAPMTNGMCGFPYEQPGYVRNANPRQIPYGTDYPWYNPIWPESSDNIIGERGIIHMYGAIHQTRRGYIHRSGIDPYNHPGDNQWEFANETYHYDGTHPSTGYHKDYHYDKRFLFVSPVDYPKVYKGLGESTLTSLEQFAWYFKTPPDNFN